MAGERLARLFKDAKGNAQDFSDILYGKVTRTNPLSIEVENRFTISKEHIVLSRVVQDQSVSFSVPTYSLDGDNLREGSRNVTVQIFRDLKVGDEVSLLRGQKGQLYYVLDRRS